jgi:hypothetical protein
MIINMEHNSRGVKYFLSVYHATMKKYCDNCLRELSKFSFLNHDKKKIYRYNTAMLCRTCFEEISSRKQLQEES